MASVRFLVRVLSLALFGTLLVGCSTSEWTPPAPTTRATIHDKPVYVAFDLHRIAKDGVHAGWVESRRAVDGNSNDRDDRTVDFIQDLDRENVGFVTDLGEAYRLRRYLSPVLVAGSSKLTVNIAAIMDWRDGNVTLERVRLP